MKTQTINIDKFQIREKHPVNQLSGIQRLVCKLFKITPKIEYSYTIVVWASGIDVLRVNDVILDEDYRRWFVLASFDGSIAIRNMVPTDLNVFKGKLVIVGSCQPESFVKP